ncbi:MAG: hypothetical protein IJW76_09725 [Clostridia bacterium]|nr:hypothetical protein [Clostridia bacterium]
MKQAYKTVFCIAFSLIFAFMAFGYAELTDYMNISGTASAEPPKAVYITNIELIEEQNNGKSIDFDDFFPTNVESTVSSTSNNGKIIYKITVFNNTPYKYAYAGIVWDASADGYNGNSAISTTSGSSKLYIKTSEDKDGNIPFDTNDSIESGQTRVFYATYTIGGNLKNTQLHTFVNYKFGVHRDSAGDMAAEQILIKFDEILNTEDSYNRLITDIDDKYRGQDWQATYIGNVSGAGNEGNSNDVKTIEDLFGEELKLNIAGEDTTITLMVKRENIDGNENTGDNYTATYTTTGWRPQTYTSTKKGCEMTLYMTADKLDNTNREAVVYIAIFTCLRDANDKPTGWYLMGEVYEGLAPIYSYGGDPDGTGSFHTDSWDTIEKTYKVTENFSYTIPKSNNNTGRTTVVNVINATNIAANTEFLSLLRTARAILNGEYGSFAGSGIVAIQEALEKAAPYYTDNNGSLGVKTGTTLADLIPILKELESVIVPFKDDINAAN